MAQYVHNDALLCLNFPQTLGDLGSRWFGRLPAASISSFGELSKAFSRQFLGNVHRKKSVAHLSQLRQGKDGSLKKYLGRFGQEVSEIGSANDEAIIAAFINNLQNGQLSFDLRSARLTSYADMMDMAGGYALAEEEEIATGGYFVHGGRPEGSKTKDQTKATTEEQSAGWSGWTTSIRSKNRSNAAEVPRQIYKLHPAEERSR